jgi:hypothetical protein
MAHDLGDDGDSLTPSVADLTLESGDEDDVPLAKPHLANADDADDDYNGPFIPRRMPAREARSASHVDDSTSPPPKVL